MHGKSLATLPGSNPLKSTRSRFTNYTSIDPLQFVGSVNRVNYNQNNDLNALAGLVSLCPTVAGEVVSVQEGNARMAEAMLQAAEAAFRPNVSVR